MGLKFINPKIQNPIAFGIPNAHSPALGIRVGLTPCTCFESIIHATNNRKRKKVLSPFEYISVQKKVLSQ